jgi:Uma2 family endonuclease
MTYEEFLAWADEDTHAEWVDGEVIVFMTPKTRHQDLFSFLFMLLKMYVDLRQLGRVDAEPYTMQILDRKALRKPDIFFVKSEHLDRITTERLEGPADLVIEIVSEDSVARDRREKLAQYAEAGIPEYWIVEGRRGRHGVKLYELQADGFYEEVLPDEDGRLVSRVLPGFWLRPGWLAADPLPSPYRVLRRIAPDAATTLFPDDDLSDL